MEQSKFLTFLPIIVRTNWTAATTKTFSLRWVKVRTFSIALVAKNILEHRELFFRKKKKKKKRQHRKATARLNEKTGKREAFG